jgi:hypothetical protein
MSLRNVALIPTARKLQNYEQPHSGFYMLYYGITSNIAASEGYSLIIFICFYINSMGYVYLFVYYLTTLLVLIDYYKRVGDKMIN